LPPQCISGRTTGLRALGRNETSTACAETGGTAEGSAATEGEFAQTGKASHVTKRAARNMTGQACPKKGRFGNFFQPIRVQIVFEIATQCYATMRGFVVLPKFRRGKSFAASLFRPKTGSK
jgi:hypothetical protein